MLPVYISSCGMNSNDITKYQSSYHKYNRKCMSPYSPKKVKVKQSGVFSYNFGQKSSLTIIFCSVCICLWQLTEAFKQITNKTTNYANKKFLFFNFQMVGAGLLGLGLTLIGDKFIHDSSLEYIFYQIQFYNYYFYDILVGLCASCVVIGILTIIISIIGLVGSWRKSSRLLIIVSYNMYKVINPTVQHFCMLYLANY